MSVKVVIGNVKSLDSKGNVVEFTINAATLMEKLDKILGELKILNSHMSNVTDNIINLEDIKNVN